jgi:transaldolase
VLPLVEELSAAGVQLNVTAILTLEQTAAAVQALSPETPSVISIFAGRIADTGLDPVPVMRAAVAMASIKPAIEILWASVREPLNLYQAQECGCHIITATADVLKKAPMYRKDLIQLSLETVEMFYKDALSAGYRL